MMVFLYGSIVVGDVQRWSILFHSIGDWCMEVAVRWHESTSVLIREWPRVHQRVRLQGACPTWNMASLETYVGGRSGTIEH
jgi:hypothetical protein